MYVKFLYLLLCVGVGFTAMRLARADRFDARSVLFLHAATCECRMDGKRWPARTTPSGDAACFLDEMPK